MAKSDKHAESSAKQYGGSSEDYLEIHEMMDSSKSAHADNRHTLCEAGRSSLDTRRSTGRCC